MHLCGIRTLADRVTSLDIALDQPITLEGIRLDIALDQPITLEGIREVQGLTMMILVLRLITLLVRLWA